MDGWYDNWCAANQGSLCAKVGSTEYVCNGNYCMKTSMLNDGDGDGIIGWYDCNDTNVNIGQADDNSCDGDGDGYIDITAGGNDCLDNYYTKICEAVGGACTADIQCASGLCGTDADGDSYLSMTAGHTGICQTAGLPFTDCYDSNASVRPGQTAYFSTHRGDGSFDYNCSGSEEKQDFYCYECSSCSVGSYGCTECASYGTNYSTVTYNCTNMATCGASSTSKCRINVGFGSFSCQGNNPYYPASSGSRSVNVCPSSSDFLWWPDGGIPQGGSTVRGAYSAYLVTS